MGAGASSQVAAGTTGASNADVEAALKDVGKDDMKKIQAAIDSIQETAKPTVWISSSGLPSHDLKCKFIATILRKRGVFDEKDLAFPADMPSDETLSEGLPEDATEKAKQLEEKKWSLTREAMVKKYAETLAVCKQVHIMDALFFRDHSVIKGWRGPPTNPDKAEEMFYWDDEIIKDCGFKVENVTIVCLNMKPWIFEDDGLFPADAGDNAGKPHHMWSKQDPKAVHGLDAVGGDEKANYMAKLQQCKDVYAYLKSKPDPVVLPKLESGKSQADELCEASTALNIKYKDHMVKWCKKVLAGADIVTGQGGDVVNLNMTWQCNPRVAQSLVRYVRGGQTIFAGHSASAMCMAKSMEMTHEISEGWLEAFAVSAKKLMAAGGGLGGAGVMFDEKDLNGVGVAANVLGALPMFESPFSMRPHFKEAWMDDVFAANKKAELECEAETGVQISDDLVEKSQAGVTAALKLLNIVGMNAADQDAPVFLPLLDGQVIVGQFTKLGTEMFHVIGKPTGKPPNTAG